jgi:hypothetical protein
MKINRSTHFMVLVLFAIAFVVVYLYYTIKDVKKIHLEIARLSNDVLKLTQSISNITNTLINQTTPITPLAAGAGACLASFSQPIPQVQVTIPNNITESESGDSVATAEMHKIMETIDDVEENDDNDANDAIDVTGGTPAEQSVNPTQIDAKQIKTLSYDALKKYCKENGIDSKGTKDALAARIMAKQIA